MHHIPLTYLQMNISSERCDKYCCKHIIIRYDQEYMYILYNTTNHKHHHPCMVEDGNEGLGEALEVLYFSH